MDIAKRMLQIGVVAKRSEQIDSYHFVSRMPTWIVAEERKKPEDDLYWLAVKEKTWNIENWFIVSKAENLKLIKSIDVKFSASSYSDYGVNFSLERIIESIPKKFISKVCAVEIDSPPKWDGEHKEPYGAYLSLYHHNQKTLFGTKESIYTLKVNLYSGEKPEDVSVDVRAKL